MKKVKSTYSRIGRGLIAVASTLNLASAAGWDTVPLGGGGFVTGLACNSNASAIYCRTDPPDAKRAMRDASG